MDNNELCRIIEEKKIIAIARGIDPKDAVKLAQALYDGGICLLEFTFNMKDVSSTNTDECIKAVSEAMKGKMYVGCGTASYPELVDRAYKAGANFIISADVNEEVIKRTKELGLISMPGALTGSEAMKAVSVGADFVKLFPIGNLGPNYAKALMGPFGHIKYLAVGGVNVDNVKSFLNAGCVGAGVGGALVDLKTIAAGEFDKITEVAKAYMKAVQE